MKRSTRKLIERLGLNSDQYLQTNTIQLIRNPLGSVWTTVYDFSGPGNSSRTIFSYFASPELRERLLTENYNVIEPDWFSPGFSQTPETVEYLPSNASGCEFIIERQDFPTINECQLHLNQEFILLLQLYREDNGNYCSIDESGNKDEAVSFSQDKVEIKTKYLLRFMSARQLVYFQFIDVRVDSGAWDSLDQHEIDRETVTGDDFTYSMYFDTNTKQDSLFSMVRAKSIVKPPSITECGIWPYDEKPENYPEFITGENPDGSFERFTCDESKLSNYFGANPGAPLYLTPVYFKPDVLDKYRKNPEVFSVTERKLSCGYAWGVEIDNVNPKRVMVYLGDLGTKLPESERTHFLEYEMSPTGQSISTEAIKNDFYGMSTDPTGPISRFRKAYTDFVDAWKQTFHFELFREHHPQDRDLMGMIHIPASNSSEEFNSVILNTTKLLIDYIDGSKLDSKEDGTINKLEDFLEREGINVSLSPLRVLQRIRSTGIAHSKDKDFDKIQQKYLTGNPAQDIEKLINQLTDLLESLTGQLQEHMSSACNEQ